MFPTSDFIVPPGTTPEEIKNKIKKRAKRAIWLGVMPGIYVSVILMVTHAKIAVVLNSFGKELPSASRYGGFIAIFITLAFAFIAHKQLDAQKVDYVSISTNEGFLKISPQLNVSRSIVIMMVGMALTILFLYFSYIFPIYSLVNSFIP